MNGETILFISDVHTHYRVINEQIHHAEDSGCPVSRVIVLGDFGFFGSHLQKFFRRSGNRFLRPVSFIDGNHEDHGALLKLSRQFADVVEYLPRSCVVPLGSLRGLCLGGAKYMDAVSTPRGTEITQEEIEACFTHGIDTVDVILTHDCPEGIGVSGSPGMVCYGTPGVPALGQLALHFKPRLWLFGHHHRWFDARIDGTRYVGLPESWVGYVLMDTSGGIRIVENKISIRQRPWWQKGLAFR